MSTENRLFYMQILIDSTHIYNSYKYDTTYNKLKIVISKFLHYGLVDIPWTDFNSNPDEGTTEVKVNKGETFMFPLDVDKIETTLKAAYIDLQIILESNDEDKVKAGIQFLTVGYTRIQLKEHLMGLISAIHSVKSDNPEIAELEGPFVIRQADLQVGTIFLGIRFTMFNSYLAATIQQGETTIDSSRPLFSPKMFKTVADNPVDNKKGTGKHNRIQDEETNTNEKHKPNLEKINTEQPQDSGQIFKSAESIYSMVATELFGENHSENHQSVVSVQSQKHDTLKEKPELFNRLQEDMQILKNQLNRFNTGPFQLRSKEPANRYKEKAKHIRKQKDSADLEREYTYVFSELNGQVIDMKIVYEPKVLLPAKMITSKCI